jgi:iron complex transport system substrate-binding protein
MQRPLSTLFVAVVVMLVACQREGRGPAVSATWVPVPTRFATKFKVWAHGPDRAVLVFGHGGEQDTVGRYMITRELQAQAPFTSMRIVAPLQRAAMVSTTHVPYLSILGRADVVVAGAHLEHVRDGALQARMKEGMVQEIATGDGVDRERMLALQLDAVFTYPFGRSEGGSLEGLGIPVVEVSEYLEEHPLGRAEWLRFFGVLLGEEHKADSLFEGIVQRYDRVRSQVRRDSMPTVLFGSYWNGQWFVPPGNSYMAKLIDDAGGGYVFADRKGEGNITVDMETMITVGGNADVWGMIAAMGPTVTDQDFTQGDERLAGFKAVQEHRLFIGNTATSDLFGRALVEPDLVLAELMAELRGTKDRDATRPRSYFDGVRSKPQ